MARTDVIDDVEAGDVPALALIGYLETLLNGDKSAQTEFEKNFGISYMGVGALTLSASLFEAVSTHPSHAAVSLVMSLGHRRPFGPIKRIAKDFLGLVAETVLSVEQAQHEYWLEYGDEDIELEDIPTSIEYIAPRSPFRRVTRLRGIAAATMTVLFAAAHMSDMDPQELLNDARIAYMS